MVPLVMGSSPLILPIIWCISSDGTLDKSKVDIKTPTSELETHTINHGGGRERSPTEYNKLY